MSNSCPSNYAEYSSLTKQTETNAPANSTVFAQRIHTIYNFSELVTETINRWMFAYILVPYE